ncbi:MAG: hypothetical protein WBB43_01625 [Limnoraphis sp.]
MSLIKVLIYFHRKVGDRTLPTYNFPSQAQLQRTWEILIFLNPITKKQVSLKRVTTQNNQQPI